MVTGQTLPQSQRPRGVKKQLVCDYASQLFTLVTYSSASPAKRFASCKRIPKLKFVWRVVFIDVYSVGIANRCRVIRFITQHMIPISER